MNRYLYDPMAKFSHLHVHTQFSLLDGAADISNLYNKAVKDQMPAIAITDHGNMFGVFKFVAESYKHNKESEVIKSIVGCEFYLVEDRHKRQFQTSKFKISLFHLLIFCTQYVRFEKYFVCTISNAF